MQTEHAAQRAKPRALANTAMFMGVIVALLIGYRVLFGGSATVPTPEVFAGQTDLREAMSRGQASGRPVFAMATADWCGPCQALKAGALADERVVALLRERTEPVYIDVDRNPRDAESLGVRSIPALFILSPTGEPIAQTVGNASADTLLQWVSAAVGDDGAR